MADQDEDDMIISLDDPFATTVETVTTPPLPIPTTTTTTVKQKASSPSTNKKKRKGGRGGEEDHSDEESRGLSAQAARAKRRKLLTQKSTALLRRPLPPPQENDGGDDKEEEEGNTPPFQNTEGLYDYYAGVSMDDKPVSASPSAPSSRDAFEIGLSGAPTVDGHVVYPQLLPPEGFKNGSKTLTKQQLQDLLSDWTFDSHQKRQVLFDLVKDVEARSSVSATPKVSASAAATAAADSTAPVMTNVKALLESLRASWQTINLRFGPEWMTSFVERVSKIESHPYFILSSMVQTLSSFTPATAFFRTSVIEPYRQWLQGQASEQQRILNNKDKFVSVIRMATEDANIRAQQHLKIMGEVFDRAMPNPGLKLKVLEKELGLLNIQLHDLPPDTIGEIVVAHTYMLPRTFALPPWVYQFVTPRDGQVTASPGGAEWQGKPPDQLPALDRYKTMLKNAKIMPNDIVLGEFSVAMDVLTKGINVEGVPRSSLETLALTGDFKQYVKNQVEEFMVSKNGLVYLEYPNVIFNSAAPNTAKSLIVSPYIPGHIFDSNNVNLNQQPVEYQNGSIPESQFKNIFNEFNRYLLSPLEGKWRDLRLYLNTKDSGFKVFQEIDLLRAEIFSQSDTSLANKEARVILSELVRMLQTGETLAALVSFFQSKMRNRDKPLFPELLNDEDLENCYKCLTYLAPWLGLDPENMAVAQRERRVMEIQYHIDFRFTILYVLLQYSFVRQCLFTFMQAAGQPLLNKFQKRNADYAAAVDDVEQYSKAMALREDSISALGWTLLPMNTGKIHLHDQVYSASLIAWSKIQEWVAKRGVPCELDDIDLHKDIILRCKEDDATLGFMTYLTQLTAHFVASNASGISYRSTGTTKTQAGAYRVDLKSMEEKVIYLARRKSKKTGQIILYFDYQQQQSRNFYY